MHRLISILTLARPHGGNAIKELVKTHLEPISGLVVYSNRLGEPMAYSVCTDPESKTLFSCHLDTVHHHDGENHIEYDPAKRVFSSGDDTPLGADDGAGIWLMLEMIDAGVPGTYIFHMGEECGGIGSKFMARYHNGWMGRFERAIAFDRKGTHSVITHQGWGRCCSDDFADKLALELCCGDYFFTPDDTGLYTDTAEYTDIIGECTNVSCGYYNEHTAREYLDVEFLTTLRDRLLVINWEALPSARLPGEPDDRSGRNVWKAWEGEDDFDTPYLAKLSQEELIELVEQCAPEDVAALIMELVDALE